MRALVLEHMAEIADSCEPPPVLSDMASMFDTEMPRLKPGVEACLKRSIELAPDRREPYLMLLDRYENEGKAGASKADKLAQTIVERFPEESSVWESLGDRAAARRTWAKAATYFAEATQRAPLEVHLRETTAEAHLNVARRQAESGKLEAARAGFGEAVARAGPEARGRILGLWTVSEYVAGEFGRPQELREQAGADAVARLSARYVWLVAVIRRKLGRTLNTEADRDFATALAEAPSSAAAVGLVHAAACERADGKYTGQAGHEKKILARLTAIDPALFTEGQLERICEALRTLDGFVALRRIALAGQQRFPRNPFLVLAEAWSYMAPKGRQCQPWASLEPLKRAHILADALPEGSARRRLRNLVTPLLERLKPMAALGNGPLPSMLESLFGDIDLDGFDPEEFGEDFGDKRPRGRRRR